MADYFDYTWHQNRKLLKNSKLNLIKIKNFCSLKYLNTYKDKLQNSRKYTQTSYLTKNCSLEYIRNPQNSILKKKKENEQKTEETFHYKDAQMENKCMKICSPH